MKNHWKIVFIAVLSTLIILVGCFILFKSNSKLKTISIELIQYDALENKEETIKTYTVKEKDKIELEKYNGNDIEVLKISDKEVEISRVAKKYKIIDEQERKSESYEEVVVTKVKYGESITIDIDEWDPFGPMPGMSRYTYSIKVLK